VAIDVQYAASCSLPASTTDRVQYGTKPRATTSFRSPTHTAPSWNASSRSLIPTAKSLACTSISTATSSRPFLRQSLKQPSSTSRAGRRQTTMMARRSVCRFGRTRLMVYSAGRLGRHTRRLRRRGRRGRRWCCVWGGRLRSIMLSLTRRICVRSMGRRW
jgi:hypothetical protein